MRWQQPHGPPTPCPPLHLPTLTDTAPPHSLAPHPPTHPAAQPTQPSHPHTLMGGVMRVMPMTLTMALRAPRMLPSTSADVWVGGWGRGGEVCVWWCGVCVRGGEGCGQVRCWPGTGRPHRQGCQRPRPAGLESSAQHAGHAPAHQPPLTQLLKKAAPTLPSNPTLEEGSPTPRTLPPRPPGYSSPRFS